MTLHTHTAVASAIAFNKPADADAPADMLDVLQALLVSTGLNLHGWCVARSGADWRVCADINWLTRPISKNQAAIIAKAFTAGLCSSDYDNIRVEPDFRTFGSYENRCKGNDRPNYDIYVIARSAAV